MSKSVQAFLGAVIGAGALVGVASSADAHHRHGGCCGSEPTRYVYHDVNHYKDVFYHTNKYHSYPVDVPRLTVHVTRIHPHVTIHNLVTIHEQPYRVIVDYSKHETITEGTTYKRETSYTTVQEPCRY
jgi:hypothetical protein